MFILYVLSFFPSALRPPNNPLLLLLFVVVQCRVRFEFYFIILMTFKNTVFLRLFSLLLKVIKGLFMI